MADVKWIKMSTDIFDNRKIKQIESLPDGDSIIVIWVKLLCLAGNINDSGLVYFTKEIPYTDQMLATQFNRPLTTIQLALRTFQQFGMVEVIDDMLHISNWEKYQNTDRLLEIREYNRLAKQKSRAKQKLLQSVNENVNDMSMTSQQCHETDIDIDKELDIDKDININNTIGTEQTSCSGADESSTNRPRIVNESDVFIELPLNDKSMYPVLEEKISLYEELYPAVDVRQELRKMRGWCEGNPTKRKTRRGIEKFITAWLSKEQDKGGQSNGVYRKNTQGHNEQQRIVDELI